MATSPLCNGAIHPMITKTRIKIAKARRLQQLGTQPDELDEYYYTLPLDMC